MATTNPSHTIPLDRITEEGRSTRRWADIWSPTIVSRVAGVCALGYVAMVFVPTGLDLHSDMSARQVLTWVSQNQQAIWTDGFLNGLGNTLLALQIVLLVALSLNRGILAGVALVGAAATMATGWTKGCIEYAIADLAHRGGADAGVLALFSLAKTMDYADGISIGLAIGCVSVLLLRIHALPRPVNWLGLVAAVVPNVVVPIQLAITGTVNGIQGPISVLLGILWLLVIGIVLLVKPVRLPEISPGEAQATA